MSYDNNNIFAKILRNEIPCDKVHENNYMLAFNDIAPQAPIHVIVIPKSKYTSIADFTKNASDEEITGFYRGLSEVIEKLEIKNDGFRTITNTGTNGRQEVPHFHIHIIGGKKLGSMLPDAT